MATRLESAFQDLNENHRLIAVLDCECCSTCAHARLSGELETQPEMQGYIFCHGQDIDRAIDSGELYLRFASRGNDAQETAAVAQTSVQVLRARGLEVEWGGNPQCCILVHIPDGDMHLFHELRPDMVDEDYELDDDEEEAEMVEAGGVGSGGSAVGPGSAAAAVAGGLKVWPALGAVLAWPHASEAFEVA